MKTPDWDSIHNQKEQLKRHNGPLPLLIRAIMMEQHMKHLKKEGLYDEVIMEEIRTMPKTYEEAVDELIEWCEKNTEYDGIIS